MQHSHQTSEATQKLLQHKDMKRVNSLQPQTNRPKSMQASKDNFRLLTLVKQKQMLYKWKLRLEVWDWDYSYMDVEKKKKILFYFIHFMYKIICVFLRDAGDRRLGVIVIVILFDTCTLFEYFHFMQLSTSTPLHRGGKYWTFYWLHLSDSFRFLSFFIPFLSSENHVSPYVMLNVCDKLKDKVFLYVLRKFSSFLS